jgi:glutaredoxin-related protein
LGAGSIAPAAQEKIATFHADIVGEVEAAVSKDDVVVVGMAQNPHVKRARKALEAAGIKFTYLEYRSYFGEWRKRLAIKMWSGYPTFPQVFVRGILIGGADQTEAAIADGSLKTRLTSQRVAPAATAAN